MKFTTSRWLEDFPLKLHVWWISQPCLPEVVFSVDFWTMSKILGDMQNLLLAPPKQKKRASSMQSPFHWGSTCWRRLGVPLPGADECPVETGQVEVSPQISSTACSGLLDCASDDRGNHAGDRPFSAVNQRLRQCLRQVQLSGSLPTSHVGGD